MNTLDKSIGESRPISLNTLIALLEQISGKKAIVRREPAQPGDAEATCANIEKARKLIGYNPQWSIERGLKESLAWLKTDLNIH